MPLYYTSHPTEPHPNPHRGPHPETGFRCIQSQSLEAPSELQYRAELRVKVIDL